MPPTQVHEREVQKAPATGTLTSAQPTMHAQRAQQASAHFTVPCGWSSTRYNYSSNSSTRGHSTLSCCQSPATLIIVQFNVASMLYPATLEQCATPWAAYRRAHEIAQSAGRRARLNGPCRLADVAAQPCLTGLPVLREQLQRGGDAAVVGRGGQAPMRVVAARHVRLQPAARRDVPPACQSRHSRL